nr:abasic site processing protein HMCES isoform X2 [Parasteatoda tepidariorum]
MCGRTACSLDKCGIQRATRRYSNNNTDLKWVEKYDWQNYQPSHNLAPSQVSPVIVNKSVFEPKERADFVITPMRWGFIPSWYRGSLESFSLKTNNCRIEGMLEKPTYRGAVTAAQRCVILAEGFYEWKAINSKQKQPYFIHFPQENSPDVFSQDFTDNNVKEISYPHLLTMAGLFDMWKSSNNEVIYSYSVITMDSSKTVAFVHERMPAISILKPVEDLHMYPVSTLVNYSKNNSVECLKPFRESEKKSNPVKHTALTAWLKKGSSNDMPAKRFKPDP